MKHQGTPVLTPQPDASGQESVRLDLVAIGQRMKEARKALRMTQDDLAAKVGGASKRGIQDNEAGKSMPGGQVVGTLATLGINVNWLMTGDGKVLLKDLAPSAAEYSQINIGALTAIMEGVIKSSPGAPAGKVAQMVVEFYMRALDEQLITPTGIGAGRQADAA